MARGTNPACSKPRGIAPPLMGCALLALALAATTHAQSAPPSHARIELIADEAAPSKTTWVGLLFHLDQGWHIYWQNPGDSGTPPKVAWQLPAGYRAGTIRWPQPVRLGSGSVIDYGYEDQVLLMAPIERAASSAATAAVPVAALPVGADVKYVVCREVCIPGKAHLTLSLPAAGGDPAPRAAEWHALFQQTRAQLPKTPPASWKISATQDKDHFMLTVRGAPEVKAASFLPLEADQIENSAGQVFMGSQTGFELTLKKSEQLAKPISTLRGLIVLGPGRAFEIAAPVAP